MEKLDLASTDNRQRIINTFVNSIYVFEDRFEVNFNCREGFEKIPLDNERFVSPIEISGEPISICCLMMTGAFFVIPIKMDSKVCCPKVLFISISMYL